MKNHLNLFAYFFVFSLTFVFSTSLQAHSNMDSVLICDVKFKDPQFDNPHAGSGFLVEVAGTTYLCTAKHVLYFAKSDKMTAVSFEGTLKSWSFHPKGKKDKTVFAGKLVNEDPEEQLKGMFKGDWLIFEVKGDIPDDLVIFKLREEALEEGEQFWFTGYPYKKANDQPVRVRGTFKGYTPNKNLIMDVPPAHYNGCSGGPVFDTKGQLVGLVSMGFFNEKTKEMQFEPAGLWYLKEVLK